MVNHNELQPGLRIFLLWLKIYCNHIGKVDIRIICPALSLDKAYFVHGDLFHLDISLTCERGVDGSSAKREKIKYERPSNQ